MMKYFLTDDSALDSLEKDLNQMLTVSKAADILGVNKTTLRRWDNEGRITCYRVGSGKHRRFRKKDVLLFLEAGKVNHDRLKT